MLISAARGRLAVVLVGARNPQNIGAAARAMQDFGFSDLRVVNEYSAPFEAAQLQATSAVGSAAEVMKAARIFDSVAGAIADCALVAGTTAIGGRGLRQPVVSVQQAAPKILGTLASGDVDGPRVALLFGSEKTGLTKKQLSYCTDLLTIPMFAPDGRHLSMNLGQAVAVCLYELTREGFQGSRSLPQTCSVDATGEDRERLTQLVLETMERSGYARRFPANARPEIVRQLSGNLGGSREEAATWMGLFRLALRAIPTVQPADPFAASPAPAGTPQT